MSGGLWGLWERHHPPRATAPSFEALSATGIAVHRTTDLDGPGYAALLRSLDADVAVLCHARLPGREVSAIPRLGTLSLHEHRLPDYRGADIPVGYWELVNRETSLGVTVHRSRDAQGSGEVLGEETIAIEPYDTLESLQLKATFRGLALYHRVLVDFAQGKRAAIAGIDGRRGCVHYPPGRSAVEQLAGRLRQRQTIAHERGGLADQYHRKPGTWLKYLLMYPLLLEERRRLIEQRQAPIISLFYHRVANDAANVGTLPLDKFVAQIELIRRYHPIISLEEAERRLCRGNNDEVAFVITFDDGYAADLETSVPYLRHFGIPATFFVSIGNILEGRLFAHDLAKGVTSCPPMTVEQLRSLDVSPFDIGCHGLYHEEFSELTFAETEFVMRESRRQLEAVLGRPTPRFAFPRGRKGLDITCEGWELADENYDLIASAYGGFNFAKDGQKHFKRAGHPFERVHLVKLMDGFRGWADLTQNNLWSYRLSGEPAY